MNGIERLQTMLKKPINIAIYKIYQYLKKREELYDLYLNPEKSLDEMYEYIKSKAKEKAVNGCAMLEDTLVYGLAVHYFSETNEKLGIKSKEVKNEVKPKENNTNQNAVKQDNTNIQAEEINEEIDEDQISFFGGEN